LVASRLGHTKSTAHSISLSSSSSSREICCEMQALFPDEVQQFGGARQLGCNSKWQQMTRNSNCISCHSNTSPILETCSHCDLATRNGHRKTNECFWGRAANCSLHASLLQLSQQIIFEVKHDRSNTVFGSQASSSPSTLRSHVK
jgi:hypothetical protein